MSSPSAARISTQSWAALLGARYPIVVAPMAGVNHSCHMASSVIEQGGIGSIGAANIKDPEQLRDEIRAVKKLLKHNQSASNVACLNVNLQQYGEFALSASPSTIDNKDYDPVAVFRQHSQKWLDAAKTHEAEQILIKMLSLNPTSATFQQELETYKSKLNDFNEFAARYGKDAYMEKYYKMVQVVLEEKPAMFTTIFGFVEPALLRAMHRQGIVVGATCTCFVTPEETAAMEKEDEQRRELKRQQAEEAVEEELLEFTPDLLEKQGKKKTDSKKQQTVQLQGPPTEAETHFQSGVDFIFLQSTHAGGHQGTVSAPLPIPNAENAQIDSKTGKILAFQDPIIERTDPTNFHNPNRTPVEALIDMRRNFTRQLSRDLEKSVKFRRAVRKSCPFPVGHPFSREFDERRGAFLDENCYLIGCGGIATGKDVVDVMNGAQIHGASIGSRFLLTKESKYTELHKYGLRSHAEKEAEKRGSVRMTFSRAFGGRWARVIETKPIRELDERRRVERVLPFPLQQGVTGKRRAMYSSLSSELGIVSPSSSSSSSSTTDRPENASTASSQEEAVEYLNIYLGSQGLLRVKQDDGRSAGEVMNEICEEFSKEYIKSKMEPSSSSSSKQQQSKL